MRIGYDAKRLFNNFTGLGNYSRTLLKNLAQFHPDHEYFLYTPKVKINSETHFYLNSPLFNVMQPQRTNGAVWRSWRVKKDLKKNKIDLYHGLSHEIPFSIQKTGIPSVVTIHDLIFRHYPEQYRWADRQIYDYKFQYACQKANHIIAISEQTKKDIIDFYGIAPEKITVIYQSCHERFMVEQSKEVINLTIEKYKLPNDFLFYVGSLIERKNLLGIVEALSQLPKSLQLPLVIVGQGDEYKKRVLETARNLGVESLLIFIKADYEDLPALYQKARIFLYPSYFEGFGIPVLEALFSRTPVLTSKISSLPEAAGLHSFLVNPADSASIADGIQTILTNDDFRQNMITSGFEHALNFRGEQLTSQLMELYGKFGTER